MAPKLKLTYFDARGRAEIPRLVMACGGLVYEDNRIAFQDWGQLKASTPLGGLPILEVDGKVYAQGIAIATYLAKEAGLYGSTNLDQLVIDEVALAREDWLVAIAKYVYEKDEKRKAENEKKLLGELQPRYLGFFTKLIKENPNKSGFLVSSKITLADIVVFEGTQELSEKKPEVLDEYPEIKALRAKVAETEGIKQYLVVRKPTPF